jgi:molybdopterin-guanine dinucleotide biosynthesis protein A
MPAVHVRNALQNPAVDAAVLRNGTNFEPFHAVFRRDTCLAVVKATLATGLKRADSWFPEVHLAYFLLDQVARYDPRGIAFLNINTPDELLGAEANARQFSS